MLGNLYGMTLLNALVLDGIEFNFIDQVNRTFDSINIQDNSSVVDKVKLELQYIQDTIKDFVEKYKPLEDEIVRPANDGLAILSARFGGELTKPEDTIEGIKVMVNKAGIKNILAREVLIKILKNRKKILELDFSKPTMTVEIYKLCNRPLKFFADAHVEEINVIVNSALETSIAKGYDSIAELVATSRASIEALENLTNQYSSSSVSIFNYNVNEEFLTKEFGIVVNSLMFEEAIKELESIGFYGFNDITPELVNYIKGKIITATQDEEFSDVVNSLGYLWFVDIIDEFEDSLVGLGEIPTYTTKEPIFDVSILQRLNKSRG